MTARLPDIILASKSKARRDLLRNAGIDCAAMPATVDERAMESGFSGPPEALALELAKAKALAVSARHKGVLVIGADQVLALEGEILHKAENREQALDKLRRLKGKTHTLISAVAVAQEGRVFWDHMQSARLTMHDFNEAFLQDYADKAGEALTRSVGAYELEGAGVWLFEKIEGDYFTILGLPLLPLLNYLRSYYG